MDKYIPWIISLLSLLFACYQGLKKNVKEDTGITTELTVKLDEVKRIVEKLEGKFDKVAESVQDVKDWAAHEISELRNELCLLKQRVEQIEKGD